MGTNNVVFLEVIEWFDESGKELLHRIPETGSGEIKWGAQMTVRESQAAVFFYNGKAYDAFGPGRHTLKTANIPLLTKILSLPWGLTSPLRAEVYFTNMKVFTNLTWGTRDPVAFRDKELGLIRLRAFGVFNLRILQPLLFINSLAGTQGVYTTEAVAEYLNRVIVSRFNDLMGEKIDTIFDLPARYDELSGQTEGGPQERFLAVRPGARRPLHPIHHPAAGGAESHRRQEPARPLRRYEQAPQDEGRDGPGERGTDAGRGGRRARHGDGVHDAGDVRRELSGAMRPRTAPKEVITCPDCRLTVEREAKFCPHCGHQLLIFQKCSACGKNLPPSAKFCIQCGRPVEQPSGEKRCPHCMTANLPNSIYCNQCGKEMGKR